MVEIRAQIVGGPVLLAGDAIQVCVTISTPLLDPVTSVQSRDSYEVIAWCSAQVHCVCVVNDQLVCLPSGNSKPLVENAISNSATSFAPWRGERGHLVLATKPKILFCDLQLGPGQSKSFIYRETLPSDSPPSYRGKLVKYAYKVTVGTQRLGSPINLLRLPLRVIVLQGLSIPVVNSDTGDLAPTNPFLYSPQRENNRQTALDQLQALATMRSVNRYNISHAKGLVGTFTVYKSSYRLGEDVIAAFDFSKAKLPCVQFSATLQSEEQIQPDCRQKEKLKPIIVPYTKIHEMCLSLSHTNFMLPIPLHVTPTFTTNIMLLKWSIHFEFVLNIDESAKNGQWLKTSSDEHGQTWIPPSKLKIETLVWDLPITICPTTPNQLSQALGNTSAYVQQL